METAQRIIQAIHNPKVAFTTADIKSAWEALRQRHDALKQQAAAAFYKGQVVEFDARGHLHRGTVVKVNQKSLTVQVLHTKWTVDAGLVRVVE